MTRIELTGQKFGRLTVIGEAEKGRKSRWSCLCECGSEKTVLTESLRSGNTKSCGCLRKEEASIRFTTHGHARGEGHALFGTWSSMIGRCSNPNVTSYASYGGRGIKVCERWSDFANFLTDMGERPAGTTLDRIDNDGDYEPGNCRWATKTQQQNNRKCNVWLTAFGETRTITQWSELIGFTAQCIKYRIKAGLTTEQALSTNKKKREAKGKNGN